MSLNDDLVQRAIVEEGLSLRVMNWFLESQGQSAVSLLCELAKNDRYCSLFLSLQFLSSLMKGLKKRFISFSQCEEIFWRLIHQASSRQLIPVFSYLLSQLQIESFPSSILLGLIQTKSSESDLPEVFEHVNLVDKILSAMSNRRMFQDCLESCYWIHSFMFHEDGSMIPIDATFLSSWRKFLTEAHQSNIGMSYLGPILMKIITNSPDLAIITESGLFVPFFARMNDKGRDLDFVQCLLNIIDHTVNVRARHQREEAIRFFDHLVDLGLFSSLVESSTLAYSEMLNSPRVPSTMRSSAKVRPTSADTRLKDSAQSLKLILRFEKKYESQLKKTSLMKILLPSEQAETSPIAYEEIKEEKEK